MKITEKQEQPPLLTKSLLSAVILAFISITLFLLLSRHYINSLFNDVEKHYRQGLVNIISVAHNLVEPVLDKVRTGKISREEALRRISPMIRSMTYEDQDGKNYIFLTDYEGTSLVQPFDPDIEMTNRIDLRDNQGVYIVKELLKAAREHPSGSFVRYHYHHFSPKLDNQEKLTYVIGLPEIECYMATGLYMKSTLENQKKILLNIRYISILLLFIVLIPVTISIFAIINRNRQLQSEISIRNKAEQDLKQSSEKYRSIFENAMEGIYQTTAEGRIISANPSFARIFGYSSPAELTGADVNIIPFYSDPDDRKKLIETVTRNGFAEDNTIKMKRKDGAAIWVSINSRIVRDESGNILYLEGRVQDITARKLVEDKLTENEKRLSSITGNMPGVIYQFYAKDSGEWGLDYTSERILEIFGLLPEMTGLFEAFYSNIHDEDRERFLFSIEDAVKMCKSWDFEGRYVRPSGDVIWFHGLSTPTRQEDSLVFDGILLDITERKQAEEMSRLTEEKFCKVFMTSPDGIIISRMKDGMLIDANEGAEKITGWHRGDVIGTTIAHDTFWADPADRKYIVSEISAGRDVLNYECPFRRNDGSLRKGNFSVRPITIAEESCLIIILRDVTDTIRLEQKHRNLEQQMAQSQKMDAIGKLAGGVAHDFNNILMIIQGYISLIMMKCGHEDPLYSKLRTVEENIQRGADLTRQLLGFAKEGKYEIRPLSVNELLRKSTGFFIETKKEIAADLQLDKNIPSVDADASQLEQVFLNIFINAAHVMPDGGHLCIRTSCVTLNEPEAKASDTKPGNYVKIAITDTGTGMDEETLKRIFEPFFTTKAEHGGTGLGLASAYGIIRNHGGVINAFSVPGKGTTFNIYLPVSEKAAEKEEKKVPDKKLHTGTGTILLIDDEPTIMTIVSEMLKTLGYDVYYASGEQEAVSIYNEKKECIDLVILDMILRGTSGVHVFKKLREIDPEVKVILSSGYSLKGEVQKVMKMGCLGFIQKPYNFTEMSEIIHKALMPDD